MDRTAQRREDLLARFVREHLQAGVVVLDGDGTPVEWNRAIRDCECDVLALLRADSGGGKHVARLLAEAREHGAAGVELGCASRAGGCRRLQLDATAIDGSIVVVVHDRSQQRTLHDEVRQLRGLASLGLLTASVAHDLNNLLTPIYALSSFLVGRLERDEQRALAGEILSAAERAVRLSRTVLTASRPRSPELEIVDVNAVVADMKPLIARLLGAAIEHVAFFEPLPTQSVLERARFEHALLNLVANARDAMPSGGRLTITTANVALGNGAGGPAGERQYVMVSVTDTGVGMSEQTCARIFDPFFTTKDGERGVGLGLASVRNFVTEIGGFVSAHSTAGKGTTVSIYLPSTAQGAMRRSSTPRPAGVGMRGHGETVLVADADADVRRAVAMVLQAHGYRVLVADSAESALRAASSSESAVDVVLLDAELTSSDPHDLRERLRAAAGGALVLMSAAGSEPPSGRSDQAAAPVAGLLRKAFSTPELLDAVRVALDSRDAGKGG